MKKMIIFAAIVAGCITISSCASKKDLENCQNHNKELTSQYQDAREQLAAALARVNRLQDQVSSCQNTNEALQRSL